MRIFEVDPEPIEFDKGPRPEGAAAEVAPPEMT